ncbi:predicted protein, partial [Thalassiosira pseudonana CCMP1335]
MSLYAASTISRQLRHQLLSLSSNAPSASRRATTTARTFSSNGDSGVVKGSGLRRIRDKGRVNTTSTPLSSPAAPSSSSATSNKTAAAAAGEQYAPTTPLQKVDPHRIANEMVNAAGSTEGRISGTEAIAGLTKEQKTSNYAMAAGLLGFVSYVFYYSLASVGGDENARQLFMGKMDEPLTIADKVASSSNPGFEEFLKEANEGRDDEIKRVDAENTARGEGRQLAELENSTSARLKAEGMEDGVIVGSASDEEEREMKRAAGFED